MMGFLFVSLFVAVPILTVAHIIMVIRGPRIFTAYCNDYQVPPSGAGWAALPPLFLKVFDLRTIPLGPLIVYSCPFRRPHPDRSRGTTLVSMVESTHFRERDDLAELAFQHRSRLGRIPLEREMGA